MRDRFVWQLLPALFATSGPASILEVGGTNRLGDRLRVVYDYLNADVVDGNGRVDIRLEHGRLALPDGSRQFVILSYVLSCVPEQRDRIQLLSELRRIASDRGRLLLLDDFDFGMHAHRRLQLSDYFHTRRFGRALFGELTAAGWMYNVVTHCAVAAAAGAEFELPYINAWAGAWSRVGGEPGDAGRR